MKTKDLALYSILAAVLYIGQVALAFLPNIEVVTLLIMAYARALKKRVLVVILVFTLLEGLTFGFGPWFVSYGYVWPLLAIISSLLRKHESGLFWALTGGFYGLFFGTLCSIPYFAAGGMAMGTAYILSGIPFDIIHCAGNFFAALFLMTPLYQALNRLFAVFYQEEGGVQG